MGQKLHLLHHWQHFVGVSGVPHLWSGCCWHLLAMSACFVLIPLRVVTVEKVKAEIPPWAWVAIAIGSLLVIVVIVLIMRTRYSKSKYS